MTKVSWNRPGSRERQRPVMRVERKSHALVSKTKIRVSWNRLWRRERQCPVLSVKRESHALVGKTKI
jgi:hypothetical protein